MKQRRYKIWIIIFLITIIVILMYLLTKNVGYIYNGKTANSTGNVDIFDITIDNVNKNTKDKTNQENEINNKSSYIKNELTNNNNDNNNIKNNVINNTITNDDIDKDKPNNEIEIKDQYDVWYNKKARIFSNPAYEFKSKIAPGTSNMYRFIIKNNNDFDIIVNISMLEENPYNINMRYKLKSDNNYIVGDKQSYKKASELNIENIEIKSNESKEYNLEWKWIDSENDTKIGETIDANYKLTIDVEARAKWKN